MKLSLGQAARAAGMSKSTLQRMLQDGRMSGHQREDGVYEIDRAELQRVIDAKDTPQRGRRVVVPAPVEAEPLQRPEAVELAVLRAELAAVRDRVADAIRREEQAEARAAEALARERALADRLSRLIEDQRPERRGFLSWLGGTRR